MSKFSHIWLISVIVLVAAVASIGYGMVFDKERGKNQLSSSEKTGSSFPSSPQDEQAYPLHRTIATEFWVGEPADESNAFISNTSSAWVSDWMGAFGGVDSPENRCGYDPCGFTPRENTFYVALPFNDIDENGEPKPDRILRRIPWYDGNADADVSLMKNRWVEIRSKAKTAYGQIEDVGPMHEDDAEYVFGSAEPKYEAGIDLSPALNDFLGTNGYETVQWRFTEARNVPDGPWKHRVTTTQVTH